MKLTIKSRKVELNGNQITGDTYPVKQWIKTYLNGKWDADHKSWIVDLGQVEMWTGTCIQIDNSAEAPAPTATSHHISELCPKCHTYCYGDCTA